MGNGSGFQDCFRCLWDGERLLSGICFLTGDKDARERRGGDEVSEFAVVGELVDEKIGLLADSQESRRSRQGRGSMRH